jgi:exodeoxyribonuclease V gamma subunit
MSSFKLYTSNKTETLLDALAEVVQTPHQSLFTPEFIIVQNKGMERWISLSLARKLGIWANCRYFFPNEFVESLFTQAFPKLPDRSILDPKYLAWKIMEILPAMLDLAGFESLKNYLSDGRQLKLFQISSLIADTFDQYSLYRPQMVREWDEGKDSQWQAVLWRALFNGPRELHRSQLQMQLLSQVTGGSFKSPIGPKRISMFGISSLPAFHREIILSLSSLLDVHMFLLNPCNEFWDDVLSEKEMSRISHLKGKKIIQQADLHWEFGNRFLASMGGFGRDFLSALHDADGEEYFIFSEPGSGSILSCLQSDILHLRERGGEAVSPIAFIKNDSSIQVHSCHSPLREIEVLYDNLLDIFDKMPSLLPSDIVVMTPDIGLYAPFIQAVFGNPEDKHLAIPFSVADRRNDAESPAISAFLSLLSLSTSRCTSTEILSLLESEHIRTKFSLSEDDVSQIRLWVADTRIYWGLDEKHRSSFVSPTCGDNTWKSGIDQMLLGYALRADGITLFDGLAPFANIEGSQADVLGRFLDFYTSVTELISSISQSHTLSAWGSFLLETVHRFFPDDNNSSGDIALISKILKEFITIQNALNPSPLHSWRGVRGEAADESNKATNGANEAREADFLVDFETVRYLLSSTLTASRSSAGFLTGAVTFCEMLPMRSIPFKIVCLLGMNDGVFPRKTRHPSWDIIGTSPRKGDRSLEKEDRYIFLEALMCAREVFYISYIGQDIKDNSAHQPSVAVLEFMDLLDRTFFVQPDAHGTAGSPSFPGPHASLPSHRVLFRHRLQAFSPFYFAKNGPVSSFSKENFAAAQRVMNPHAASLEFFPDALPELPPQWQSVTIADLCDFFSHPARFMLNKRLGISLSDSRIDLQDTEPFTIEGLDGYAIGQLLVEQFIKGESRASCRDYLKAKGMLPHGNAGLCAFAQVADEVSDFVHSLTSLRLNSCTQNILINGTLGGFAINGIIPGFYPPFLCRYRFGRKKPKDIIALWIQSLAFAAFSPEVHVEGSIFAGRDGIWEISGIENGNTLLKDLLECYKIGLSKLLPFFPLASWTFAEEMLITKSSSDAASRDALKAWVGSDYEDGEIKDEYLSMCYKNAPESPLGDEFRSVALRILTPLFGHLRQRQ